MSQPTRVHTKPLNDILDCVEVFFLLGFWVRIIESEQLDTHHREVECLGIPEDLYLQSVWLSPSVG